MEPYWEISEDQQTWVVVERVPWLKRGFDGAKIGELAGRLGEKSADLQRKAAPVVAELTKQASPLVDRIKQYPRVSIAILSVTVIFLVLWLWPKSSETVRSRAGVARQTPDAGAADREVLLLTPVNGERDIFSDARIREAVKMLTKKPNGSEREREEIERQADKLVKSRQRFIDDYNGMAVASNGAGIEVWLGTKPNPFDKEKARLYLLMVNMTPHYRWPVSFEVIFSGSKRNMALTSSPDMSAVGPLSIQEHLVGEYYVDKGQTMKVENVSFR